MIRTLQETVPPSLVLIRTLQETVPPSLVLNRTLQETVPPSLVMIITLKGTENVIFSKLHLLGLQQIQGRKFTELNFFPEIKTTRVL